MDLHTVIFVVPSVSGLLGSVHILIRMVVALHLSQPVILVLEVVRMCELMVAWGTPGSWTGLNPSLSLDMRELGEWQVFLASDAGFGRRAHVL